MNLILNIDTSLETSTVCLSDADRVLKMTASEDQKEHASWIHKAIEGLFMDTATTPGDLSAVGVSIGPGSYTGLRVGLATAKGFCYALNIPLICNNTLEMMTVAVLKEDADLFCPLIDARRMEVFTAVYNKEMIELQSPSAKIIDENSFQDLLSENRILFFGNGVAKVQQLVKNPNAKWGVHWGNSSHLSVLTYQKFLQKKFSDLAYTEPLYVKEFYSPPPKTSV
jgi:tRNA threonylcarbamoyladenosine biosynthesis protein TsaB